MRLTPARIGVLLICGQRLPPPGEAAFVRDATMPERIRVGHDLLVQISGRDFGYDLSAWHEYLKVSRDGGYTWGPNIVLPRIMKAALASDAWRGAAAQVRAGDVNDCVDW